MKESIVAVYVENSLHKSVRNHAAFQGEFLGVWVKQAIDEFLQELTPDPNEFKCIWIPPEKVSLSMVKLKAPPALARKITESAKTFGISRNRWVSEAVCRKIKREVVPAEIRKGKLSPIKPKRDKKKVVQYHLTEKLYLPVKALVESKNIKLAGWITAAMTEFYKAAEFEELLTEPIRFPGERFTSSLQIEEDLFLAIEKLVKRVKKQRPNFSISAFIRLAIIHKLSKEEVPDYSESLLEKRPRSRLKGVIELLLPFSK